MRRIRRKRGRDGLCRPVRRAQTVEHRIPHVPALLHGRRDGAGVGLAGEEIEGPPHPGGSFAGRSEEEDVVGGRLIERPRYTGLVRRERIPGQEDRIARERQDKIIAADRKARVEEGKIDRHIGEGTGQATLCSQDREAGLRAEIAGQGEHLHGTARKRGCAADSEAIRLADGVRVQLEHRAGSETRIAGHV